MEKELEHFLMGKWLGKGVYREVYAHAFDKSLVLKIANDSSGREINMLENRVWWEVCETPIAKWFAPVLGVSECGKYLLQKRVEILPKDQYPKELPAFFTDTKYSNFGYLKGKGFVCCDFGSFNMWRGIKLKMKKVDWWE